MPMFMTGGDVNCMRRHECSCGKLQAYFSGSRVIFVGFWGQSMVRNGLQMICVPRRWTSGAISSVLFPSEVVMR
jgi:hypothetical protein